MADHDIIDWHERNVDLWDNKNLKKFLDIIKSFDLCIFVDVFAEETPMDQLSKIIMAHAPDIFQGFYFDPDNKSMFLAKMAELNSSHAWLIVLDIINKHEKCCDEYVFDEMVQDINKYIGTTLFIVD